MKKLVNGEYIEMADDELKIENRPIQINYEQEVINLIRQKYSVDDELAIQRQRETKQAEFQEYYDYCEQCKNEIKETINELQGGDVNE